MSADSSPVAPQVAEGIPVRWADPAAPWLAAVGGDPRGTRWSAAVVARVALRYDDDKAGLMHDEEYEAVLHPLGQQPDASLAIGVDYDDRDLRPEAPPQPNYVLPTAPVKTKTFWSGLQRGLVDHLVRSRTLELQVNRSLKAYARPGETPEAFFQRCYQLADAKGDEETAALRDKYQTKVLSLRKQLIEAEGRAQVLNEEAKGRRNQEILSTAGSILGGLLGGSKSRGGLLGSVFNKAGTAAGRRGRSNASAERLDAAEDKIQLIHQQLEGLEGELTGEVTEIDMRWMAVAKDITTMPVTLEKTDVKVTQIALVWLPVA